MRNGVAQAQEDLGNLVGDAIDKVARANLLAAARKRHVDGRRADGSLKLLRLKRALAIFKRSLHHVAHLVHRFADGGALLFRHLAHAAQVARQRTGLAQHGHAHLVKRGSVSRRADGSKRAFAQRRKFVHDCHVSDPFLF